MPQLQYARVLLASTYEYILAYYNVPKHMTAYHSIPLPFQLVF